MQSNTSTYMSRFPLSRAARTKKEANASNTFRQLFFCPCIIGQVLCPIGVIGLYL